MTKIYLAKHPKESVKQQHCPTCNRYVKFNEQHQNLVCSKCILLAADKSGKRVAFYSITLEGNGCQGKYVDDEKLYRSSQCFISGIKCKAIEIGSGNIGIIPFKTK